MFSEKEEKVYEIQKYILSHLYEKLTLDSLAARTDLSEWQCYRIFKEIAGISIADYIRRAKLADAACKLKEEQKKVIDVALEAGYDSPDGFQRAFLNEFGCNPAEYEKSDIPILSYVPYDIKYRSKDLYKPENGRFDKIQVDNGKAFDFGKTAEYYGRFRDIYPSTLFEKLYSLGIGKAGTRWLDLGTGTGVFPRNLYQYGADITATDISEEQLEIARNLSLGMDNIHYEKVAAEVLNYPEHSFDVITACQCFWYFNPDIVVPKIKSLIKQGGIFLKLYISYLKEESVTQDSNALVKKINPSWHGAASALEDLRRHYFENPQLETFITEIPFTRESWHGRMLASRGVMASMNEEQLLQFDKEHRAMLEEKYPEKFGIKHKIFLTWYKF